MPRAGCPASTSRFGRRRRLSKRSIERGVPRRGVESRVDRRGAHRDHRFATVGTVVCRGRAGIDVGLPVALRGHAPTGVIARFAFAGTSGLAADAVDTMATSTCLRDDARLTQARVRRTHASNHAVAAGVAIPVSEAPGQTCRRSTSESTAGQWQRRRRASHVGPVARRRLVHPPVHARSRSANGRVVGDPIGRTEHRRPGAPLLGIALGSDGTTDGLLPEQHARTIDRCAGSPRARQAVGRARAARGVATDLVDTVCALAFGVGGTWGTECASFELDEPCAGPRGAQVRIVHETLIREQETTRSARCQRRCELVGVVARQQGGRRRLWVCSAQQAHAVDVRAHVARFRPNDEMVGAIEGDGRTGDQRRRGGDLHRHRDTSVGVHENAMQRGADLQVVPARPDDDEISAVGCNTRAVADPVGDHEAREVCNGSGARDARSIDAHTGALRVARRCGPVEEGLGRKRSKRPLRCPDRADPRRQGRAGHRRSQAVHSHRTSRVTTHRNRPQSTRGRGRSARNATGAGSLAPRPTACRFAAHASLPPLGEDSSPVGCDGKIVGVAVAREPRARVAAGTTSPRASR